MTTDVRQAERERFAEYRKREEEFKEWCGWFGLDCYCIETEDGDPLWKILKPLNLGPENPLRYVGDYLLRLARYVWVDVKSASDANAESGFCALAVGAVRLARGDTNIKTYFVWHPGPGHRDEESGVVQGWGYLDWRGIEAAGPKFCCDYIERIYRDVDARGYSPPIPEKCCHKGQPYLRVPVAAFQPIEDLVLPDGEPPSESV